MDEDAHAFLPQSKQPEESLDAHTAQLVESIVGDFYKPLVEMIDELEDRVQALERRISELEQGRQQEGAK